MSLFKCKMCGGTLELNHDETVGICEYCGTRQTLPKLGNEQKANLYERANHLRRNNEYDKAMGIYEQILNADRTDAESYWSLVLCRYGIEYVEDPENHKRIPTVNRAQFTSIFADEDYKSAIYYADSLQKEIYEHEAKAIDEIQKGILAISQKEKPFDVFICYKETDSNGRRTPDSVLATDLYHQLKQEGFKVFFSRITLEDKLGVEYEPYIFAALNSAKVMVVLGTKPEYFNAVWVKNEWSRYLALIKNGAKKMLIPAYRDMDPYDLPEEFSHLQAQDMSKLGFMQDLIRGIKKIVSSETAKSAMKETVVISGATSANAAPLLRRVFIFLEDGDFANADEYCEKVLDMEPENAEAYLGKMMAELRVRKREDLALFDEPFDGNGNYKRALRFADETFAEELRGYISAINERKENRRLESLYRNCVRVMETSRTEEDYINAAKNFEELGSFGSSTEMAKNCRAKAEEARIARLDAIYNGCIEKMGSAKTETDYKKAADFFKNISGYRDADEMAKICLENAEKVRLQGIYDSAKAKMAENKIKSYEQAIEIFRSISTFEDSENQIYFCQGKIEEIKAKEAEERIEKERKAEQKRVENQRRKENAKRLAKIWTPVIAGVLAFAILLNYVVIPNFDYIKAEIDTMVEEAKAEKAEKDNPKEPEENLEDPETEIPEKEPLSEEEIQYQKAVSLAKENDLMEAVRIFAELGDYKNSKECYSKILQIINYKNVISTQRGYTVAIKNDGKVVATGNNEYGQCDVEDWTDIVAVSSSQRHTVGLRSDGTVVATGDNHSGQCDVSGWENIVAIATGVFYTFGLKSDGTVVAVGYGEYEFNTEDWTDIVSIHSESHSVAGLKKDGTVVATGRNNDEECNVSEWTDVVDIKPNWQYTMGLKSDGTVVAVGLNKEGQFGVSNWKDIAEIETGGLHTVGLKTDGTVVAIGYNHKGQCNVSNWKDITDISVGDWNTAGLKSNGTVVSCGEINYNVSNWKNIILISASIDHLIGIRADGTVVATGDNKFGQCNVSSWTDIKLPEKQEFDFEEDEESKNDFSSVKVGDIITFGSYEQDNNLENGKEPIEWQVLDVQDGKALVISKYGLDCKQYDTSYSSVTWETCSLRKWLNNEFVKNAFSTEDQESIVKTNISNPDNVQYGTNGGKDTEDKVFLLSIEEVKKYNIERKCEPSVYSKEQGTNVFGNGNCWWWLRSPGYRQNFAAGVNYGGVIIEDGLSVGRDINAVRPAMWVDLSAFEEPQEPVITEEISVGSVVTFGSYEQDNNLGNGTEPIEWQVLDIQDGKALVISKYGLDCKPYDSNKYGTDTWETCSLRKWLNNKFFNNAFSSEEQKFVQSTELENPDNLKYDTDGGNATKDKIFLFSIDEAGKYLSESSEGACVPTAYAKEQGAYSASNGNGWWWLRSPGAHQHYAARVAANGIVQENGYVADDMGTKYTDGYAYNGAGGMVRPSMWVDLSAFEEPQEPVVPEGISVGDVVTFGSYEQDNNLENGAEAIEWQVLDIQNGKALVISKYVLAARYFDDSGEASRLWEYCSLRKWLNGVFIENAFNAEEENLILTTKLVNHDNPEHGTDGGNDTEDKVFLLSIDEAEKYFSKNSERKCKSTSYANEVGEKIVSKNICCYWLRSSGVKRNTAAFVFGEGVISKTGYVGGTQINGVRPAMWIDLSAFEK